MAHIHEKIDFTIEVFIVHDNKVLLRMHDKYNKWLAVGGHIELDEDPIQAIYREVQEEVGLPIELMGTVAQHDPSADYTELLPPVAMNRHKINDQHEHVTFIYFAKTNTDQMSPAEGEPIAECHWFTEKELSSPEYTISEDIKRYALAALNC